MTPKHPEANSEVERIMATVGNAFERARRTNPGKWRETIINAVKALRATPHRVTGISPFEATFGLKMRPGNIAIANWIKDRPNNKQRFESIENRLFDSKIKRQQEFEENKNVKAHQFRVGDKVFVILEKTKLKRSRYDDHLYQVTDVLGSRITAISLETKRFITRHSTHFKLYIPPLPPSSPKFTKNNVDFNNDNNKLENDTVIEKDNDNGNDNADKRVHLDPRRDRNRGNDRPRVERVGDHVPQLARQGDGPVQNPNAAVNREPHVENALNNERMTRSRGRAPEIENVLKAPIERSKEQQRKFKELHNLQNQNEQQNQ